MTFSCAVLAPNYSASYYVVLISFFGILTLAYFTTKWLSRMKFNNQRGKNMQVVERLHLAADKLLLIVMVDEAYYLMAQDKSGVKLIDKLEDFKPEATQQDTRFSDLLNKIRNSSKDK